MKIFQPYIPNYTCPHLNSQGFSVFDWLGSKLTLHLCVKCQKIPEFEEIISNNKIKREVLQK